MKKYTVLITAVGGDIGQSVLTSLKRSSYKLKTIGTDCDDETAGLFLCDYGERVPAATKDPQGYTRAITDICQREKVDLVFVCHEAEQKLLAKQMETIKQKTPAHFVVQPDAVLALCMDKMKCYRFLEQQGIRVPQTAYTTVGISSLIKKFGFPLIVKSRQGSGSRGFQIVKNRATLAAAIKSIKQPLVQEYITNKSDEEYTVGLFLDNNSVVLGAIPMLRKLRFGMTWHGIVDDYSDVVAVARQAVEAVKAIGPCNVQLRRDQYNQPCVIEINARISSSTAFRAHLGFNEAAASLMYFLEHKKPHLRFKKGVVMKRWGEVVIPTVDYTTLQTSGRIKNKPRHL